MNIGQLKKKIADLPDTMDIFIKQTNDEFPLSAAETGNVKEAAFSEDEGGPVLARENVFIITDDFE